MVFLPLSSHRTSLFFPSSSWIFHSPPFSRLKNLRGLSRLVFPREVYFFGCRHRRRRRGHQICPGEGEGKPSDVISRWRIKRRTWQWTFFRFFFIFLFLPISGWNPLALLFHLLLHPVKETCGGSSCCPNKWAHICLSYNFAACGTFFFFFPTPQDKKTFFISPTVPPTSCPPPPPPPSLSA